jgi:nucleoside-diphosphate-sugar epimerase
MRVLVTGASGFVGRALCSDLHRGGYQLRAAVRHPAQATDLCGDVVSVPDLAREVPWRKLLDEIDVVVHLAARVHVMKDTAADPIAAFRAINVSATRELARAAVEHEVRRLVYVSSIKVNGEGTNGSSFTERDEARPRDPYGVSKWEAEQALWAVAREGGLEVTVVRPPLVYGPHVGGNFLRLLKLVRSGIPLPFGAIENSRSMIYVGNLSDALIACATREPAAGSTYLVSDGEDLSTARLVAEIGQLMGKRGRLLPIPEVLLRLAGTCIQRADEVDRLIGSLRVDSSAIRTELAWNPPFSVMQGLQATVSWFESVMPKA